MPARTEGKRGSNCQGFVMTPKTTTERVADLRRRRSDAGLVRVELYAHADDVAAIREAARKAKAERALQKMAEDAQRLGLGY